MQNNTLFIVDDEISMLRALQRVLRSEGYAIYSFLSPEEALLKVRELTPAVIVTDQCMPDMAGNVLLSEAITIDPKIEGIILSGFSPRARRELENSVALWRCLAKPFRDDELRNCIARAFQLHNSPASVLGDRNLHPLAHQG